MAITAEALGGYVSRIEKSGPKNPLVKKFIKTNEALKAPKLSVSSEIPSTIAATSAPVEQAAPTDIQRVGAASNINDQQQSVQTPEMPTETQDPMGNLAAIRRMGTAQTQLDGNIQRRKDEDAARAAQSSGSFMDYYDPSLAGPGPSGGGGMLSGLDAEQSDIARRIIEIGKGRGMSDQQIQIGIMTAFTESGVRNLKYGDRDSQGIFQQRPSQGWGTVQQVTDPTYSINKFYDALKSGKGNTPWEIAQSVQRSFDPTGSNYQKYWNQAQQVYSSYSSGAATAPKMGANGAASWISSNTNKYHDYDGAYGAQCVDLYNFYTTGFVGGDPQMGRVQGGKDIWNNHDPKAFVRVAASQAPQMGDVVVWGGSWGGGYGHVGIVQGRNPNGTLRVLNANATPQGSRGNTVVSNLGTNDLLGYLRPRKLM